MKIAFKTSTLNKKNSILDLLNYNSLFSDDDIFLYDDNCDLDKDYDYDILDDKFKFNNVFDDYNIY